MSRAFFIPTTYGMTMRRRGRHPGSARKSIKQLFGRPPAEIAEILATLDIPIEHARALAPDIDLTMGQCVLSLYRSAAQPAIAELGQRLANSELPPGLVFLPTEDPYTGTQEMCESMAERLRGKTCRLEGLGHWWMFAGAPVAAEALISHWA
jgi:hypothetical protein